MIYEQFSRIANKAITSGSFTIPSTNDFTDGTWVPTDLMDREIGIVMDSRKVYMRIDDTIIELLTNLSETKGYRFTVGDEDVVFGFTSYDVINLKFMVTGRWADNSCSVTTFNGNYFLDAEGNTNQINDPITMNEYTGIGTIPFVIEPIGASIAVRFRTSTTANCTFSISFDVTKN